MAKFTKFAKLDKEKSQDIIIDLCEAIASTRNSEEAATLLTDLLGKQELEMIAKRLRIAELLMEGCLYEDIVEELKTSPSTIARVQAWLESSGEGYRLIVERTKRSRKARTEKQDFKLGDVKRKFPMYFWPQILLMNWVKSSNQKQKIQMSKILAKLNSKTKTYKELESLLRQDALIKNK